MSSNKNLTRKNQVWQKMCSGDTAALHVLYNQFYHHLFSKGFSLCLDRQLTKDVIHELFLQVWMNRKRLSFVNEIESYLQESLCKKIIDALKKGLLLENEMYSISYEQEYPYEEVIIGFQVETETQKKLDLAFLQLTKKQVEIIKLCFFEHKSYEQIAQLTNTNAAYIFEEVYEAVRQLRYHLSKIST